MSKIKDYFMYFVLFLSVVSFLLASFFLFDFSLYYSKNNDSFKGSVASYITKIEKDLFNDSDIDSSVVVKKSVYKKPIEYKSNYNSFKPMLKDINSLDVNYSFDEFVISYEYTNDFAYLKLSNYSYIQVPKADFEAYFHYADKGFRIKGSCYKHINNQFYTECYYDFYNPKEG